MNNLTSLFFALVEILRHAVRISIDLFKIMVPVIIAVKMLQEFDLIRTIAYPLRFVMEFVGLPPEMGLVFATSAINSPYSAIVVLATLFHETPINEAQTTVLCTMMILAHSLPIELRIVQKCGARLLFQAITRIGSAFVVGWILNMIFTGLNILQGPPVMLFNPAGGGDPKSESLFLWMLGETRNLLMVFVVVFGLLALMKILNKLKITDFMNKLLQPVLRHMGIGGKASTITIVGLTLGLTLGAGLIIHEVRTGNLDKKDVFYSLTLMGICHSLIEDTMLMMLAGGNLLGLLWSRLVFSFLFIGLLVRVCRRLSSKTCGRYLYRSA